ncbi:hypothetical protein EDD29_1647 [Actinocorallia herbida]|uniref:2TM domain-containing protein n=1 Tax=Actinocorallia herbida TaxID=58109 RepID=A0A3N1CS36_9ACTN|nr:hypothetical protein [Actinocorallia herbida]ROO84130.1 hypothetical protein EDD29_1647 [Actinocorallia herbida]
MLVALVIGAEIAFWVLLGLGLLVRYGLRRRRLGGALLLGTPLVDLALLTITALDLERGGQATGAHGLAAIYLGVSVGFGHQIIGRMDAWAAHRWDGAPAPARKPKHGRPHAAYERRQFARHVLAWAVGSGLLMAAVRYVGDADRTGPLLHLATVWTVVLVIDAFVSLSYTFSPRPEPEGAPGRTPQETA